MQSFCFSLFRICLNKQFAYFFHLVQTLIMFLCTQCVFQLKTIWFFNECISFFVIHMFCALNNVVLVQEQSCWHQYTPNTGLFMWAWVKKSMFFIIYFIFLYCVLKTIREKVMSIKMLCFTVLHHSIWIQREKMKNNRNRPMHPNKWLAFLKTNVLNTSPILDELLSLSSLYIQ